MNGHSLKWALIASLVLNIFLLGAIAGGTYQWFASRPRETASAVRAQAQTQQHALRFAADQLSDERRQQFAQDLQQARRDGRSYVRSGREGRRDVLSLLGEPELNRPALDAALARTRNADEALRARIEQAVADFAASLSPQERAQFADSLREYGQWRQPAAKQPSAKPASQ
ncbi:periplasmic heavy metal sensor [Paraburkholderia sp. SARCC-3016]|uniref:periplasmic heavy metal sensor n=1 Tax=Paraburkholderia sp. SARCC-3016 TaxID=3058611 RepID=UPI002808DF5B|nr:periplasmic heavy metal sensor [Paraburkholderia sp. SARCC-3016]MDQ7978006.1 periplasmic heavy metal sensor [Paraburkholderia sp. SARCC-3016]